MHSQQIQEILTEDPSAKIVEIGQPVEPPPPPPQMQPPPQAGIPAWDRRLVLGVRLLGRRRCAWYTCPRHAAWPAADGPPGGAPWHAWRSTSRWRSYASSRVRHQMAPAPAAADGRDAADRRLRSRRFPLRGRQALIKIAGVPPEEMRIDRYARTFKESDRRCRA